MILGEIIQDNAPYLAMVLSSRSLLTTPPDFASFTMEMDWLPWNVLDTSAINLSCSITKIRSA